MTFMLLQTRLSFCAYNVSLLFPFLLPSLKMTQNELQMQLLDVYLRPCFNQSLFYPICLFYFIHTSTSAEF